MTIIFNNNNSATNRTTIILLSILTQLPFVILTWLLLILLTLRPQLFLTLLLVSLLVPLQGLLFISLPFIFKLQPKLQQYDQYYFTPGPPGPLGRRPRAQPFGLWARWYRVPCTRYRVPAGTGYQVLGTTRYKVPVRTYR